MSGGPGLDLVAALLRVLPARAYCLACLASILDLKRQEVTALTKRLDVEDGFASGMGACANCDEVALVFRFTRSASSFDRK